MEYVPRLLDEELQKRLASTGAVVIEGPKACGKTSTARQVAASEVLLDVDESARRAIEVDPSLVLEGETPRLIDEWHLKPEIWNHIRRTVDERREPGQFILTGSALPADDITRHTGAGRLSRLRMRPLTLYELGEATGELSLATLLEGHFAPVPDPGLEIPELAGRVAVGGWPGNLNLNEEQALQAVRDYLDEIRRADVPRVDETRRDPTRVAALLRSLARNVATYASNTTLATDAGDPEEALSRDTVRAYLTVLERLMIVEDQPAWAPHLRSKSRIRSAAKRHFVDPSLAVAALRASPERLLDDLELFGFVYESMVIRDLRIYAQLSGGTVLQYRDNTGLEVDAVIETADGRWSAFEIKLGTGRIDEAAASLRKFANRVDTDRAGDPGLLGVIVGNGYGYMRDDGVSVLPLGALGP